MIYEKLLVPILFSLDPEVAHDGLRAVGRLLNNRVSSSLLSSFYKVEDSRLETELAGLAFKNPIGLAAGFDKNAELLGLFSALGFGHLELGTVTGRAQPGNPKPRIFRLSQDGALINRMGFPSIGADAVKKRLEKLSSGLPNLPVLGINIGKSKEVDLERATEDYVYSFKALAPLAQYVAVNVSSPNTQGLRQLQEKERLAGILMALSRENHSGVPIFVKLSPDLTRAELDDVLECCDACRVAGVIATNTTLSRDGLTVSVDQAGGLSGAPLRVKSLDFVRRIHELVGDRMALIGVGGVSSVDDVVQMLGAGASLVQLYTALIYEGPRLVARLNKGLLLELERLGIRSVGELRGTRIDPRELRSQSSAV